MIEIKFSKKKKGGMSEFSKKALVSMIILWFIGAIFGFLAVTLQLLREDVAVNMGDLLMYIGAPMTGGIVGYMLKSAAENREKIKGGKNYGTSEDQIDQP